LDWLGDGQKARKLKSSGFGIQILPDRAVTITANALAKLSASRRVASFFEPRKRAGAHVQDFGRFVSGTYKIDVAILSHGLGLSSYDKTACDGGPWLLRLWWWLVTKRRPRQAVTLCFCAHIL
jgi:hypothetical protein